MQKSYFTFSAIAASLLYGTALLAPAQAQSAAGPAEQFAGQRPAGVPADYRPTPFGWVHRACIVALKKGETPEAARKARGTGAGKCPSLRFDNSGAALPAGKRPAVRAIMDSYYALASAPIPRDYDRVSAVTHLIVPPKPSVSSYQIIHLNTGLHDADSMQSTMIHTAVAWNLLATFSPWTASIWYASADYEETYHTPPVEVTPGDELVSRIEATQANGQTSVQAAIVKQADNTVLTEHSFAAENFNFNSVMSIGMENFAPPKCNYLPTGNVITYPHIEASVAVGGGSPRNISSQIAVDPPPAVGNCNIVLTLQDDSTAASAPTGK